MTLQSPKNRLLATLPPQDWDKMRPHFHEVPLVLGQVLFEADDTLDRLYFPTGGVVSSVAVFESGATAEMATTGREGMVGVGAALGGDTALSRFLVQVPGAALVTGAEPFARLQREIPTFRSNLLAYTQAFLAQLLQSVACTALHTVEERAARWLLMMRDRSDGDSFPLTQEILAQMLGTSRVAVNLAARRLQLAGLITYSRGVIRILDRAGLEDISCECYGIVRRRYERSHGIGGSRAM